MLQRWVTNTNHKDIGTLYFLFGTFSKKPIFGYLGMVYANKKMFFPPFLIFHQSWFSYICEDLIFVLFRQLFFFLLFTYFLARLWNVSLLNTFVKDSFLKTKIEIKNPFLNFFFFIINVIFLVFWFITIVLFLYFMFTFCFFLFDLLNSNICYVGFNKKPGCFILICMFVSSVQLFLLLNLICLITIKQDLNIFGFTYGSIIRICLVGYLWINLHYFLPFELINNYLKEGFEIWSWGNWRFVRLPETAERIARILNYIPKCVESLNIQPIHKEKILIFVSNLQLSEHITFDIFKNGQAGMETHFKQLLNQELINIQEWEQAEKNQNIKISPTKKFLFFSFVLMVFILTCAKKF